MFKFNFSLERESNSDAADSSNNELNWLPAEKILFSSENVSKVLTKKDDFNNLYCGKFKVKYIGLDAAFQLISENECANPAVQIAEELHSDLVPAKYEGGLKIWECTMDVLNWMNTVHDRLNLKGKTVLDLGCGAGLIGLCALQSGAYVVFQDYNKEVIEATTIPNVYVNLSENDSTALVNGTLESSCEFYAGDWSYFAKLLLDTKDIKFDYIFTSETIYNPSNHTKLYETIKSCLKKTGTAFLAAKTYYFGVGGGLRQFQSLIEEDGKMKSEVCWKCSEGVQREILQIKFL